MQTLVDVLSNFILRGSETAFVYRTGVRRFEYSYAWVYDRALCFATWLSEQGVESGDKVVVWAPNSPWWAVAYWGIVARGAVVVPVDFMSGRDRAEKIYQWSESVLCIQSQYKLDRLEKENTVLIESLEFCLTETPPLAALPDTTREELAVLVYTSGTTGDPKGVMLLHRNLVANLKQVAQHITIKQQYRFLSLLPLSHMFEQMAGFLVPLSQGASIVYVRTLKPSAIMSALRDENIYVVPIVPRLLSALKMSIEQEFERKKLTGLLSFLKKTALRFDISIRKRIFFMVHKKFGKHFTMFVSGGSALDAQVAGFWKTLGFKVLEGYGLTECTPILTANTLDEQIIGSVGRAIPGVELTVRDNELLAKGNNIFKGYYKNKSATQKTFTHDGWFKTGDLGTIDHEGLVWVKGRSKDVIVTGDWVNVYPDYLETVLL